MAELIGSPAPAPEPRVQHPLAVPRRLLAKSIILADDALMNGLRVVAGPGAGKSRWAARALLWQALIRGRPLICLDPTGTLCANVFDKLCRQPQSVQEALWPRIQYVDMAASDYLIPMPLYERRSGPGGLPDSLLAIANRFLEVIKRLDPYLHTASVEGMNALYEVGMAAGMMAAALGGQVGEVAHMIHHPERWKQQFKAAYTEYPELQPAYDYFQKFMQIKNAALRRRQAGSFLIKLLPFLADPGMKALFAAPRPGIDLDQTLRQGHAILYDFQGEHDPVRRRMKLLWCFLGHVEYFKARGIAGRQNPILYVVDEITQLLGQRTLEHSIMADDINELATVLARNMGIHLCVMHQNLSQVDPHTQVSLGQLGTQIVGWVQEPRDCLQLAEQFFRYDPALVRKREPVWMGLSKPYFSWEFAQVVSETIPTVVDYTTTEHSIDEQLYLLADQFRTLGRFHFLVRTASAEGTLSRQLRPMSIEKLDPGCYPDDELVAEVRRRLRKRDGVPIATLLREIEQRHQEVVRLKSAKQKPVKPKKQDVILEKGDKTAHEPQPAGTALPAPTAADDDFWQEVT